MKLVPDWKEAGKWWSVQLLALNAALQLAWETLPADALQIIPADWRGWIAMGLCLLAIMARMIDQAPAEKK
jgi:hypothetical protein